MNADRTLISEIRKLNGDGSREARFEALTKIREARKMLSSPCVVNNFDDCIKKHGRAVTAICVAATLIIRKEQINYFAIEWAQDVIKSWTNKKSSWIEDICIDDGLHPTRICEYAAKFIFFTSE